MSERYTLTTSDRAVRHLRKVYAAQGTPWPRGVSVVRLPGNRTGNTMLVSRSHRTLWYIAASTGGSFGKA